MMAICSRRSRSQRRVTRLAAGCAAGLLAVSTGCGLKNPPDAAAIRTEALPSVEVPDKWVAPGAGAGTVADNWLVTFHDDQLTAAVAEAIIRNADLRVAAARVEQAQL